MSIDERCCGSYNETKQPSFEFTVRRARLDVMNILGTTENYVSEKKNLVGKVGSVDVQPQFPPNSQ